MTVIKLGFVDVFKKKTKTHLLVLCVNSRRSGLCKAKNRLHFPQMDRSAALCFGAKCWRGGDEASQPAVVADVVADVVAAAAVAGGGDENEDVEDVAVAVVVVVVVAVAAVGDDGGGEACAVRWRMNVPLWMMRRKRLLLLLLLLLLLRMTMPMMMMKVRCAGACEGAAVSRLARMCSQHGSCHQRRDFPVSWGEES